MHVNIDARNTPEAARAEAKAKPVTIWEWVADPFTPTPTMYALRADLGATPHRAGRARPARHKEAYEPGQALLQTCRAGAPASVYCRLLIRGERHRESSHTTSRRRRSPVAQRIGRRRLGRSRPTRRVTFADLRQLVSGSTHSKEPLARPMKLALQHVEDFVARPCGHSTSRRKRLDAYRSTGWPRGRREPVNRNSPRAPRLPPRRAGAVLATRPEIVLPKSATPARAFFTGGRLRGVTSWSCRGPAPGHPVRTRDGLRTRSEILTLTWGQVEWTIKATRARQCGAGRGLHPVAAADTKGGDAACSRSRSWRGAEVLERAGRCAVGL